MKRYLAVLALTAMACGSSTEPRARPRFASTIAATACPNGKFSLTTSWQVPSGTWKAIFVSTNSDNSESSKVDEQPTKTSTCLFSAGNVVYAILFPVTVESDADTSPTLTVQ